jgi:uncharacterized RDD family membrane protein YckC
VAEPKLDTLQSIELAEGVQILLRPAGPLPRAWALMIDMLLVGVFFAGESGLMLLLSHLAGFEAGVGVWLLLVFATYWGYFVLFEVLRRGQTPGKKMMGLRVVRTSGERVGWGASFLRNLVRFGDMMPLLPQWQLWVLAVGFYLFGVASCLVTRRFQRLGDLVADTVVVYAREEFLTHTARLRADVTPIAPPLVLTREEQQAFIQFSERAPTWSDARKEEMVTPLAPLLGAGGREGVMRALAVGVWLRES